MEPGGAAVVEVPAPFTLRPDCPKCSGDRFSMLWMGEIGLLRIRCERCTWDTYMRPKDG